MNRTTLIMTCALLASPAMAEVSTPRQIADRASAHCQSPRWAPDGSQIAYDVFNPKKNTRETWIVKLTAGGGRGAMTEVSAARGRATGMLGAGKAPVVEFAWAPNMKLLSKPFVFSSRGVRKNFDLFADGTWLTDNVGNDGQPAWSPDGRYIAYASQQRNSGDVMLLDLGGESERPTRVTLWPNATEYRPRWAPKQNHLVFTRSETGANGLDIGLVTDALKPADSTRMLTNWRGDEVRPSWAPSGKKVAFYANKGNKNEKVFDLWVINTDGSAATKLATDVVVDDHQGPVWTPDSSTVIYVKQDFQKNNPVQWARVDGSGSGTLDTGTQLNSDLSISSTGGQMHLVFRALGQKGSTEKTWERIYIVSFGMSDLQSATAP